MWQDLFSSFPKYAQRDVTLDKYVVWGVMIAVALLGAAGNILFKVGTEKLGAITPQRFLDISFIFKYLFSPAIFTALILLFLGRFLTGTPLSVLGATQAFVIVTVLSLAFTLALETVVFKQIYDVWTYAGIVLGLASIALISRGMTFT